jgi:hypothetical protein
MSTPYRVLCKKALSPITPRPRNNKLASLLFWVGEIEKFRSKSDILGGGKHFLTSVLSSQSLCGNDQECDCWTDPMKRCGKHCWAASLAGASRSSQKGV